MEISMNSAAKLRLPNPPVSPWNIAKSTSPTITASHTARWKFSGGKRRTMQNSPARAVMFASE